MPTVPRTSRGPTGPRSYAEYDAVPRITGTVPTVRREVASTRGRPSYRSALVARRERAGGCSPPSGMERPRSGTLPVLRRAREKVADRSRSTRRRDTTTAPTRTSSYHPALLQHGGVETTAARTGAPCSRSSVSIPETLDGSVTGTFAFQPRGRAGSGGHRRGGLMYTMTKYTKESCSRTTGLTLTSSSWWGGSAPPTTFPPRRVRSSTRGGRRRWASRKQIYRVLERNAKQAAEATDADSPSAGSPRPGRARELRHGRSDLPEPGVVGAPCSVKRRGGSAGRCRRT